MQKVAKKVIRIFEGRNGNFQRILGLKSDEGNISVEMCSRQGFCDGTRRRGVPPPSGGSRILCLGKLTERVSLFGGLKGE